MANIARGADDYRHDRAHKPFVTTPARKTSVQKQEAARSVDGRKVHELTPPIESRICMELREDKLLLAASVASACSFSNNTISPKNI